MTKQTQKFIRFEKKVTDGFKAAEMFAPVETLTARQYMIRKNRESKNQKPDNPRFS